MDTYQPTSDLPTPRTPSPSLVVEQNRSGRRSSLTRRRSWGNNKLKEAASAESSSVHPLHLDIDANMSSTRRGGGSDPFLSSHERPIAQYNDDHYSDPLMIGTSSRASLMHGHFKHELEDDGHREDDEAHLTSNMSRTGTDTLLLEDEASNTSPKTPDYNVDPEIDGGSTPRTRRRTLRYSLTPSPLKKTETAIKSVSKNLKKMSLRVVNLANTELEGHLRLGDGNEEGGNKRLSSEDEEDEGPPPPELKKVLPIRGRALGFLGPESKTRLALFNFLVHPCVFLFYSSQVFDFSKNLWSITQVDGTYDSNINRTQCCRVDQSSVSIFDVISTWKSRSIYTPSHQWIFSYLGGLYTLRFVYYFYVRCLSVLSLWITE